jgi:hypothetical protein
LFNKSIFSAAAPTFELLLTRDRIVNVPKVLQPNEPVQTIAFRKSFYFPISVLVQTALNIICDSKVQRDAMFVRENGHPVVVVAYLSQK